MLPLERDGLSAEEVKRILHASDRKIGFEYRLLDRNDNFKAMLNSVMSCRVDYKSLSSLKLSANIQIKEEEGLSYGVLPTALDYTESGEDFEQGELDGVVAGEDGLELEEVESPTFTRTSKAYLSDGTEVDAGVARFEQGKFDKAVLVEEGTTNLFSAEDSSFEGGTIGNWTTYLANAVIITGGWHGAKAVQVTATASNGRIQQRIDGTLVNLNDTVTLSVYAKLPNGAAPMDVTLSITIGGVGYRSVTKQITSDKWTRLSVTTTLDTLGSGVYAQLFAGRLSSDTYGTVIWEAIQLEKKPYATSFIDSTRSPETLTIPTAGVLNPQEGAVAFRAWLPEGPRSYIFAVRGNPDNNNNNRLFIYGDETGSGSQLMRALIGTGSSFVTTPTISTTRKAWHFFAVRWTATTLKLTIDNTTVEVDRAGVCTFGDTAYIGSSLGASQANSLIDELAFFDYAPTDEEIQAWYEADAPIPITEHTTYLLRFDNDFVVGKGGARKSLPLDLSSLGTVKTSEISWQATTPTDTSLKVETSLSTDSGETWGAWQQATNGGSIPGIVADMDLSNAKLKTRATLETEDTSVQPVLEILNISLTGEKEGIITIDYLNDRLQPVIKFQKGETVLSFPLGILLLNSPARKDRDNAVYREIECYSKLQILQEDKYGERYYIPASTNYTTAVSQIIASAGETKINIVTSESVLQTDKEYDIEMSKLEIVNELLKEINYNSLRVDVEGYFISEPYVLPVDREIEYEYLDNELSVIAPTVVEELDLFNVPNVFVRYLDNPERPPLRSVYTNDNPDSLTSTVSRGRNIVDIRALNDVASQEDLDELTRRDAYNASQVYGHVEFETAIMPFHDYLDCLYLRYQPLGIQDKYTETSWSIECRAGGQMQHTVRKVVNV